MQLRQWLEIALLLFMISVVWFVIWQRLARPSPKGIGERLIQFIALLILVPVIVIMALEEVLPVEALITLLGTIVGYTLGGLSVTAKQQQ